MPQNNISGMPPEYAQQLADILRRRQMAQGLYNAQLQNRPTEMGGGGKYNYAVRQSPLEAIARLATGYVANKADQAGSDEQAKLLAKNSEEESLSLQTLAGVGPQQKELLAQYLASNRPSIRAAAEARRKYFEERGDKLTDSVITTARDYGDPQAAADIATGKRAPEAWQWGGMKEPEFKTAPSGGSYVLTRNMKNEPRINWEPKKNEVKVQIGDKMDLAGGQAVLEDFQKTMLPKARTAMDTVAGSEALLQEFERGATTGAAESWITLAQKFGKLFGADVQPGPKEAVSMQLSKALIANAKALAPVTEKEITFLERTLGSLDTDPNALAKAIAWQHAHALKALQELEAQRETNAAAYPEMARAFDTLGATVRYPQSLNGPGWWNMEVLNNLQRMGGDVSRYGVREKESGRTVPLLDDPSRPARFNVQVPDTGLQKTEPAPISTKRQQELERKYSPKR